MLILLDWLRGADIPWLVFIQWLYFTDFMARLCFIVLGGCMVLAPFIKFIHILKAYSQISYTEGVLKNIKIWIFLHLFVALPPLKNTFPKRIKQKSYQCEIRAIFP